MLPSIVDEIYKVEKILEKWSYPGKAVFSYSRGFKIKIFWRPQPWWGLLRH